MESLETKNSANASKKKYVAPKLENLGDLVEITRNGFSKGNDVGQGKSGEVDDPGAGS